MKRHMLLGNIMLRYSFNLFVIQVTMKLTILLVKLYVNFCLFAQIMLLNWCQIDLLSRQKTNAKPG